MTTTIVVHTVKTNNSDVYECLNEAQAFNEYNRRVQCFPDEQHSIERSETEL